MICKCCNKMKDLTDFNKKKNSKIGYYTTCKACLPSAMVQVLISSITK